MGLVHICHLNFTKCDLSLLFGEFTVSRTSLESFRDNWPGLNGFEQCDILTLCEYAKVLKDGRSRILHCMQSKIEVLMAIAPCCKIFLLIPWSGFVIGHIFNYLKRVNRHCIQARTNHNIYVKLWDVITHPLFNTNSVSVKLIDPERYHGMWLFILYLK